MARGEHAPLAGLSADLWKFFDLVDAPTAISFLELLGLHDRVSDPLRDFYQRVHRTLTVGGFAGPSFSPHQSILQGCAWSGPLSVVYGTVWALFVEAHSKAKALSYADDW